MNRPRVAPVLLAFSYFISAGCGGDDDAPTPDARIAAADAAPAPDAASPDAASPDAAPAKLVSIYGVDGNLADYGESELPERSLLGMVGTLGSSATTAELEARLLSIDPTLEDMIYGAETYDTVIVIALAAELARSSESSDFAPYINGVTARGDKCTDFAGCLALINAGKDIDYDGQSGPLTFSEAGEPTQSYFQVVPYLADNNPNWDHAETSLFGDAAYADPAPTRAPAPRNDPPTGGPLKLGGLFPLTGGLAFLGPQQVAALRLAVKDIDAAGGVNGLPLATVEGDSGDLETDTVSVTVADFIAKDVDAIIGASSSSVSFSVIDTVIEAGIVMFSPANTAAGFTDYPDEGLYFRAAPSDALQGHVHAELIRAAGHERVGILALDETYGTSLAGVIAHDLRDHDFPASDILRIVYDHESELTGEAAAMKAFAPDAIVLVGFDETERLISHLNELGIGPARP